MKKAFIIAAIAAIVFLALFCNLRPGIPKLYTPTQDSLHIFPDYKNITIPNNIAPLNFSVEGEHKKLVAKFSNATSTIEIKGKNGVVQIPLNKWHTFLETSGGETIRVEVFTKDKGDWIKYPHFNLQVSKDAIDSHIVFRHINAGYILWDEMGIYQRDITNFDKSPILENTDTQKDCMNCHTFHQNDPSKMMIHLRGKPGGTLLLIDGKAKMINTKTDFTMSAGVYPAWHPNGNLIAYSVNRIHQNFHSGGMEQISVSDEASDLVVYNIEKNEITTSPLLSTPALENMPMWSGDGKYLYYISCDKYYRNPRKSKYDLLRIAFNADSNKWGAVDTLLKASVLGQSITFPEPSPDGKHLLFTACDFGYFSIHRHSADLYLMDLETGEYHKPNINSAHTESFHRWSKDGKWILFVSKRLDGLYSRVFFSHVNENGTFTKPFVLPQKDPAYNQHLMLNYNRPVFVTGPVNPTKINLADVAWGEVENVGFDASVNIDALSGATKIKTRQQKAGH